MTALALVVTSAPVWSAERADGAGFSRVLPAELGVAFTNRLTESRWLTNMTLLNGSGVALGDVDGDGRTDVFLCALEGPNALWRNLGDWRFTNIIADSPGLVGGDVDNTGAVLADIDGDGDLDLLVSGYRHGVRCFLNDGRGRFTEVTDAAGLRSHTGAMSLALVDLDGDGDLDLYVTNYRNESLLELAGTRFSYKLRNGQPVLYAVDGRPVTEPDLVGRFTSLAGADGRLDRVENGEADVLYLNDGHGHFTPVSWVGGAFVNESGAPLDTPPYDWGLAVQLRDFNGDGRPDIYVANDFHSPDRLWFNATVPGGPLRFRAAPWSALRHSSRFSMGCDVGDLDRDGHDDLFVADMLGRQHGRRLVQIGGFRPEPGDEGPGRGRPQFKQNVLQWGRGDGTFAEAAAYAGLAATDWTWSAVLLDVDLDGFEDLLVTTGNLMDSQNADVARELELAARNRRLTTPELAQLRRRFAPLPSPNRAFRNRGDRTFEDRGTRWGFDHLGVSQGMALGDLDGDGDLDVVVNTLNEGVLLLRNNATAPRVAVRLQGRSPNTRGIGARITVRAGTLPAQSQVMSAGGRYLSSDDPVRTFATGGAPTVGVEVLWPSGRISRATNVVPAGVLMVEPDAIVGESAWAAPERPVRGDSPVGEGLFRDVSERLGHVAAAPAYDDFARQPLLPRRLSTEGPGVTWVDLDGDGREDLVLTGQPVAWYRNDGAGGFRFQTNFATPRAVTTLLPAGDGWIAAESNWVDANSDGEGLVTWHRDGARRVVASGLATSLGPLSAADVDGDGILDVFAGGRVVAGAYPRAGESLLFRGAAGGVPAAATPAQRWPALGLVTGSVFTDVDGDGQPDLLLATEWGPPRLFRNVAGRLEPWDPTLRWPDGGNVADHLSELDGWWSAVAAGDFDGDGRMDWVIANWGLNSVHGGPFTPVAELPQLYALEAGGGLPPWLLPARRDPESGRDVSTRDGRAVGQSLPWVAEAFPTLAAFAAADVEGILAGHRTEARRLAVRTLASCVFLNRGDHFDVVLLPAEAQLAPASGVGVADFDGDGHEDIFLTQNFFGLPLTETRADAGRGLVLLGDGRGGFRSMTGSRSGVRIYGEQRGIAVADFNADGRPDVCVAQAGAPTCLLENQGARPGLRVRLVGPAGNPTAVGAQVCLRFGSRSGPTREIHCGAGRWSVDSPILVLAKPEPPTALWVRWPGGRETLSPLPPGAGPEVAVNPDGTVELWP